MTSILAEILVAKRARLARGEFAPVETPRLPTDGARLVAALARPGTNVLAEIKRRSPSAGPIFEDAASRLESVARAYRRGGAAAISVVVEQDFFGGDPAWLPRAKAASGLPVLMKDFVVDERQLDFAVSLGADGVLLVVAALSNAELVRLHAAARERGLAVLVEAHGEAEVRRAAAVGAGLVGINARDLATFRVDLEEMVRAAAGLPANAIRVAESGIAARSDVERLERAGYGAFLVGESLLRAADPARALRALRGEGGTEIKVCGVTRPEDLAACEAAGVDWIGFNVSPLSPRRLTVGEASRLREAVSFAKGVALVVASNAERDVAETVARIRPDVVQVSDPVETRVAVPPGPRVWRAVRPGRDDLGAVGAVAADALLFDAPGGAGGTGRTFDWSLLAEVADPRPRVVAGGLRPGTVADAIRAASPAAVDVASGVERAPGVKDAAAIEAFVRAVRATVAEARGGLL